MHPGVSAGNDRVRVRSIARSLSFLVRACMRVVRGVSSAAERLLL